MVGSGEVCIEEFGVKSSEITSNRKAYESGGLLRPMHFDSYGLLIHVILQ